MSNSFINLAYCKASSYYKVGYASHTGFICINPEYQLYNMKNCVAHRALQPFYRKKVYPLKQQYVVACLGSGIFTNYKMQKTQGCVCSLNSFKQKKNTKSFIIDLKLKQGRDKVLFFKNALNNTMQFPTIAKKDPKTKLYYSKPHSGLASALCASKKTNIIAIPILYKTNKCVNKFVNIKQNVNSKTPTASIDRFYNTFYNVKTNHIQFLNKEQAWLKKKVDLKKRIKAYDLETYHRSNQDTCLVHKPAVKEGDWIQTGDLLADCASSVGGELAIGHNIIVAYMPWEGFNYEDAILINERLVYDDIYTSIHIERYEVLTKDNNNISEQITREIPDIAENEICHLDKNGIAKIGSWIEEGDILVGKVTPFNVKTLTPQQKLLYKIFNKELSKTKDSSLRAPRGIKANVINVNILARQKIDLKTKDLKKHSLTKKTDNNKSTEIKIVNHADGFSIKHVHIYLAEKRKIIVGDKMAGRHGNKGIISRIFPRQDMPFLPDGTCIDIVLNPLGVPSRMNVGQIYECLLGLAGFYLGEHYKIPPFDEKYGADASRSFVLSKLYDARTKTGLKWLLDPNNPGKIRIFDGRTSEGFHQSVTVGIAYVLKLVHMVDDKLHMRSTGPYSLVTQQPLRGRSKQGGQRLGEMEVWAIEGYGAAFVLSEMLTIKSDDMVGRQNLWKNLIENNDISLGSPESFKVLVCELQALCLDIGLFRKNQINQDQFSQDKTNSAPNLIEIDSLLQLA